MDVEKIFRDVGLAEALKPRKELRHDEAVRRAIDVTGKVNPKAAPTPTPVSFDFRLGTSGKRRAPCSGILALITAYAEIAPTTGIATYIVSSYNPATGDYFEYTGTIQDGQQQGDALMPQAPVAAGTLFSAWVDTAAGASQIDVAVTITAGG